MHFIYIELLTIDVVTKHIHRPLDVDLDPLATVLIAARKLGRNVVRNQAHLLVDLWPKVGL